MHVYLNFVQVLSQSVANAIQTNKDEKHSALLQFIEMMSNTFNILNIRQRSEGKKTRKWKQPLTTTDDWRFEVGKKAFYDHNSNASVQHTSKPVIKSDYGQVVQHMRKKTESLYQIISEYSMHVDTPETPILNIYETHPSKQ